VHNLKLIHHIFRPTINNPKVAEDYLASQSDKSLGISIIKAQPAISADNINVRFPYPYHTETT
jgi:nuclear transport factor 2 (NTF2) superfamily protein